MNINYHYFTIKALTTSAGFTEDDAQLIAEYSQFVDDFDTYRYLFFKDIPDYAQYLATKIDDGWLFKPVTTGFNSFFDYVRLSDESNQKKILIPFHFMTKDPLTVVKTDRKDYRVVPVTMEQPSLLQGLLGNVRDLYLNSPTCENMIRIGTLLHIYADSYAHQRFSGFWNWENYAYLKDVVNNITLKNVTPSYHPDLYFHVPSIGHPNVSSAPDESFASFTMIQQYDQGEKFPYKANYSRRNCLEFLKASREILNYLRSCQKLGKIDDAEWNTLSAKLNQGFLITEKDVSKLISHWSAIFPDVDFHYDKNDLMKSGFEISLHDGDIVAVDNGNDILNRLFCNDCSENLDDYIITGSNDNFFLFNVIADSIRNAVDQTSIVERDQLQAEFKFQNQPIHAK